jgi:hypothetical protein
MDEPSIQVLTTPIFYPLIVNHLGFFMCHLLFAGYIDSA